jgi:hypothetical protein
MKRPTIKEKAAQEYATYLEDRLDRFEAKTTVTKFYVGLKKQVDNISELFDEIEVSQADLKSKDDKFFDRYFQYLRYSADIVSNLESIEKKIAPKKEDERKIKDGASLEKHVFSK